MTNVGGGYIDDNSHADYGKFIAPVSGTYQFLVTISSSNQDTNNRVKIDLVVNGSWKVNTEVKDKEQVGTCHLVGKFNEGDEVCVVSATYNTNYYKGRFTYFSGHLVRRDNLR